VNSTYNLVDDIKSIQKEFDRLIQKDNQIDTDYAKAQKDINSAAGNNLSGEEKTRSAALAEAEADYKDILSKVEKKRDSALADAKTEYKKNTKQIQSDIDGLNVIEQIIPETLRKKYQVKQNYPPAQPDFQTLRGLLGQLNVLKMKWGLVTLGALIVALSISFSLAWGMVGVPDGGEGFVFLFLGIALGGIFLIAWPYYKKYRNKKNLEDGAEKLLDGIMSGRAYLTAFSSQCRDRLSRATDAANQQYSSIKAEADRKKVEIRQYWDRRYGSAKNDEDKRKADKQRFSDQQRKARTDALESEFNSLLEHPDLPDFENRLLSALEKTGALEDAWKGPFSTSTIPEENGEDEEAQKKRAEILDILRKAEDSPGAPEADYPEEIMIGAMNVPVSLPDVIVKHLQKKLPLSFSSGKSFRVPFAGSMDEPVQILIDYDADQKDVVMEGIQAFIMKLIRFMPMFSYSLTYIDPNERGANLGALQKLCSITYFDVCKKVYASREDIQGRLKELEAFVDATIATLAGIDSVYEYDHEKNPLILRHFIFINDFPDNFDRGAMESLDVLLKNARKCGMSMIVTTAKGASGFPVEITQNFRLITLRGGAGKIKYEGVSYDFLFDEMPENCEKYIENFKTLCNEGVKFDNGFFEYFSIDGPPKYGDATGGLRIPFAVDSRAKLVDFELGSALTAHAIMSGSTGSGKSTTLHMLIISIIMKYRPEDVQLWLVDYKRLEFEIYMRNTPPHVTLVGLERSPEFTFSLLDMIDAEFQKRTELFKKVNAADIQAYRKQGGKIPRIVLVIDEFHQMTQAIQDDQRYRLILENILSEYRALGLSCVFSDQAISSGLRGLSEKGKMQITTRIAMRNDLAEMKETLSLDYSFYTDELKSKMNRMSEGDVIFKREVKDKAGEKQIILDKYKTVYISQSEIKDVIDWVKSNNVQPEKKALVVDGRNRSRFDPEAVKEYEEARGIANGKQIPIYAGTPANLDPCFCFSLREKMDSNIMVIGANDDMRAAVAYWSIYSFKQQNNCKVYIFADEDDELYSQYRDKFEKLADGNTIITTDLAKICGVIDGIRTNLKSGDGRSLIVWLGLELIAEEFSFLPEKSSGAHIPSSAPAPSGPESFSAVDKLTADIDAMLNAVMGNDGTPKAAEKSGGSVEGAIADWVKDIDKSGESAYNIGPDIQDIITRGPRYGVFTLAAYSSYKLLRDTKFVKVENFEHKIAFKMSTDESSNYLGRGAHASGLDDITAVYYDGIGVKSFRPYEL
jgi:hypothetical protein